MAILWIFRNAGLVFQFNTAMRFTDDTLTEILQAMRTPGGRKLRHAQRQALVNTASGVGQPADTTAAQRTDPSWYHVCYCWSVITMVAFMLARVSAQKAGQTLFYVQAVDQPLALIQRATEGDLYEELLTIPSVNK